MKCEICHKADAETAITRGEGDKAEELYVCKACAREERVRRQQRSQRTRKIIGLGPGMSMSVTEISGGDGERPPIIGALMNAFEDMVNGLEKASAKSDANGAEARERPVMTEMSVAHVKRDFRIGNRLHLEGLQLIGDLDATKRAVRALKMELVGVDSDGVKNAGHAYGLRYSGSSDQARRIVEDLVREERNARIRLFEEFPRVLGDSICRALAIMKNCRLLSPGEFFDLLSPLRIAAREDMLDGIRSIEIEKMIAAIDLSGSEDKLDQDERDRVDSERADQMNRRFEEVVLSERAEGHFL